MDERLLLLIQVQSLIEGYFQFRRDFGDEDDFPLSMKCDIIKLTAKYDFISQVLHLNSPEYYVNVNSGDLYLIHWIQNRPGGKEWVRVSKEFYDLHGR